MESECDNIEKKEVLDQINEKINENEENIKRSKTVSLESLEPEVKKKIKKEKNKNKNSNKNKKEKEKEKKMSKGYLDLASKLSSHKKNNLINNSQKEEKEKNLQKQDKINEAKKTNSEEMAQNKCKKDQKLKNGHQDSRHSSKNKDIDFDFEEPEKKSYENTKVNFISEIVQISKNKNQDNSLQKPELPTKTSPKTTTKENKKKNEKLPSKQEKPSSDQVKPNQINNQDTINYDMITKENLKALFDDPNSSISDILLKLGVKTNEAQASQQKEKEAKPLEKEKELESEKTNKTINNNSNSENKQTNNKDKTKPTNNDSKKKEEQKPTQINQKDDGFELDSPKLNINLMINPPENLTKNTNNPKNDLDLQKKLNPKQNDKLKPTSKIMKEILSDEENNEIQQKPKPKDIHIKEDLIIKKVLGRKGKNESNVTKEPNIQKPFSLLNEPAKVNQANIKNNFQIDKQNESLKINESRHANDKHTLIQNENRKEIHLNPIKEKSQAPEKSPIKEIAIIKGPQSLDHSGYKNKKNVSFEEEKIEQNSSKGKNQMNHLVQNENQNHVKPSLEKNSPLYQKNEEVTSQILINKDIQIKENQKSKSKSDISKEILSPKKSMERDIEKKKIQQTNLNKEKILSVSKSKEKYKDEKTFEKSLQMAEQTKKIRKPRGNYVKGKKDSPSQQSQTDSFDDIQTSVVKNKQRKKNEESDKSCVIELEQNAEKRKRGRPPKDKEITKKIKLDNNKPIIKKRDIISHESTKSSPDKKITLNKMMQASKKIEDLNSSNTKDKRLRVLFSNCNCDDFDPKIFKKFGIYVVTTTSKHFDILIMENFKRTIKFLLAVTRGISIVRKEWLEESIIRGKKMDYNNYLLQDKNSEKEYHYNLKNTLEKRRNKDKGFLYDYGVWMPPNIQPSYKEIKLLVKESGGIVLDDIYKGNSKYCINLMDEKSEDVHEFIKNGYVIHSMEFLYTGILRQRAEYERFIIIK